MSEAKPEQEERVVRCRHGHACWFRVVTVDGKTWHHPQPRCVLCTVADLPSPFMYGEPASLTPEKPKVLLNPCGIPGCRLYADKGHNFCVVHTDPVDEGKPVPVPSAHPWRKPFAEENCPACYRHVGAGREDWDAHDLVCTRRPVSIVPPVAPTPPRLVEDSRVYTMEKDDVPRGGGL